VATPDPIAAKRHGIAIIYQELALASNLALIYISHRMAEIYELSDRVAVLRDGGNVGTLDREALSADALVKMMVGRDLSSFYTKQHDAQGSRGPLVLEVRGMTNGGRRVKPCSFRVHQGKSWASQAWWGRAGPSSPG
jgi:ribose transport system ATP-binding protein